MSYILALGGIVLFLATIIAAFIGVNEHFGAFAAVIFIIIATAAYIFLGWTIPITIAAFFCAMDVWEWNFLAAALFTAPSAIPGIWTMIFVLCASLSTNHDSNRI